MINYLTRAIRERIHAWAAARTPDLIIGGHERPYMKRWWLIPRNRLFNVYVHQFLRSDDDTALHDHPWLFNASWLLDGEYTEHTIARGGIHVREKLRAGAFKLRFGPAPHRVELKMDERLEGVAHLVSDIPEPDREDGRGFFPPLTAGTEIQLLGRPGYMGGPFVRAVVPHLSFPYGNDVIVLSDFDVDTLSAPPQPIPCWTVFITGPMVREWGFHCPDTGWIPWKQFTAADDPGRTGRGCA